MKTVAMTLGTLALAAATFGAEPAPAAKPASKAVLFSGRPAEAERHVREALRGIEMYQAGPNYRAIAEKAVALDPEFAFAHYLVGTSYPGFMGNQGRVHFDKAKELAPKAGDAERRYLEAIALSRDRKNDEAVVALEKLTAELPGERAVVVSLAQVYTTLGRSADARKAFEKAIALDPASPRAYALLGNLLILDGEYAQARAAFEKSLARIEAGVAPGQPNYGLAMTYLYEGKADDAIKTLHGFQERFGKAAPGSFPLPDVFIWNAIARINLENGHAEEALKAYAKGFESVPGSNLDEIQKQIWLGRLHHGRGRSLSRLGKHEEAWKEADIVKKMIDEGGERGKEFLPAYHYLAGYLKLEAGDVPAAITHLKEASADPDSFRLLLLARAYERAGDKEQAKAKYQEIVDSKQNNLERALAYPEAKKKLAAGL